MRWRLLPHPHPISSVCSNRRSTVNIWVFFACWSPLSPQSGEAKSTKKWMPSQNSFQLKIDGSWCPNTLVSFLFGGIPFRHAFYIGLQNSPGEWSTHCAQWYTCLITHPLLAPFPPCYVFPGVTSQVNYPYSNYSYSNTCFKVYFWGKLIKTLYYHFFLILIFSTFKC